VGARDVAVTIEAGSPPATVAATVEDDAQCGDWHSWHSRRPGSPPSLYVVGRCVFATSGYTVELRPADPQGFNPNIYLLEKVVTPPTGAVADVISEVPVQYREVTNVSYTHVQIIPDNVTVEVYEVW
jgi:hypothetical protein